MAQHWMFEFDRSDPCRLNGQPVTNTVSRSSGSCGDKLHAQSGHCEKPHMCASLTVLLPVPGAPITLEGRSIKIAGIGID